MGAADASVDGASDAALPLPVAPVVRAGALAVLPPRSIAPGMSHLLAAAGCIGGSAFTDGVESSICGADYRPDRPTLAPVLVRLSSVTSPDAVGLQFVNACSALASADLRSIPAESSSATDYTIAESVAPGQIAPRVPARARDSVFLGANGDSTALQVFRAGNSTPAHSVTWSAVREASGVVEVRDGRSYTVVLAGPNPSFQRQKWWNGPLLVLVPNAPD
jgi:hypothetical protein